MRPKAACIRFTQYRISVHSKPQLHSPLCTGIHFDTPTLFGGALKKLPAIALSQQFFLQLILLVVFRQNYQLSIKVIYTIIDYSNNLLCYLKK